METRKNELQLVAEDKSLSELLPFVKQCLGDAGCTPKTQRQVATAAEEVFVNIAHYAYGAKTGPVSVRMEVSAQPPAVTLTFADRGLPFDPLAEPDPDVSLSGEERGIGGLGSFMTKMIMDELQYQYSGGQSILTMKRISKVLLWKKQIFLSASPCSCVNALSM